MHFAKHYSRYVTPGESTARPCCTALPVLFRSTTTSHRAMTGGNSTAGGPRGQLHRGSARGRCRKRTPREKPLVSGTGTTEDRGAAGRFAAPGCIQEHGSRVDTPATPALPRRHTYADATRPRETLGTTPSVSDLPKASCGTAEPASCQHATWWIKPQLSSSSHSWLLAGFLPRV